MTREEKNIELQSLTDKISELTSFYLADASTLNKEELIGEVITLLQSPATNVISALSSSGGSKIASILQTLSEKE